MACPLSKCQCWSCRCSKRWVFYIVELIFRYACPRALNWAHSEYFQTLEYLKIVNFETFKNNKKINPGLTTTHHKFVGIEFDSAEKCSDHRQVSTILPHLRRCGIIIAVAQIFIVDITRVVLGATAQYVGLKFFILKWKKNLIYAVLRCSAASITDFTPLSSSTMTAPQRPIIASCFGYGTTIIDHRSLSG